MTVRYEAGQHAKQLNDLTIELRDILKIRQNAMLLKERLGHTLFEVI
jgi:acid phosphatase family membrane protein YuiD